MIAKLRFAGICIGLFLTGFSTLTHAQTCVSVNAGPDVTICAPNCTTLTATVVPSNATTSYSVAAIPYAPDPFNVGTAVALWDDQLSGAIPLPFPFCFYGTVYNSFYIGSNGFVSFTPTTATWVITNPIPDPSGSSPRNCVMGPWQDINPGVGGQVRYQVYGTAPCRRLVVSWYQVPMYSCGTPATQQIILYETTNIIDNFINVKPLCSSWNSGRAIQGIHNAAGTAAVVVGGRNSPTQWTANNEGWRYTPTGVPTYAVTWWIGPTQVGTGLTFNACPAVTTTYTCQVVHTNCNGNQVTVTDQVIVNVSPPLTVTVTPANPTYCAPGSVVLTATGGVTYTWSPATNLSATTGAVVTASPTATTTYTVVATNLTGCTGSATVTVTVNPRPTITVAPITICSGSCNTLTATGANTYTWSPATGLSATTGATVNACPTVTTTYTVTGTSVAGCTNTTTVTVTVNPLPTVTISPSPLTLCNGNCGNLTASGAATYTWSPATFLNATTGATVNACPTVTTTYTVTGTSVTGCSNTATVTVNVLPLPTVTVAPISICSGNCGTLSASGANTYTWSPATGLSATTGANVNACPTVTTTYTVTGTAVNGCTNTTTVTVTVNVAANLSMTQTNVLCNGGCTGTATVTATGGNSPYTYAWAPSGGNAATATGLCPGTYTVTVTTANGCTRTSTVTITQPPALNTTTSSTQATCGAPNGSASVVVTGGTPAYTYVWAPSGGNASTATGLTAGSYTVTVTDANGCTRTAVVVVPSANGPSITIPTSTNVSCNGGCNGTANSSVTGGTAPYTYVWSPSGGNGANATGLCAGTFTVTVTDANGCTSSASIVITQPTILTATTVVTPVTCNGGCNGTATVTAGGGTPGYTYSWAPSGGNAANAVGLCAGTYTVTVTDANGCTRTATAIITQPAVVTATTVVTPVSCNGGCNGTSTVTAGGGIAPYTYAWAPSGGNAATATGLCAGTYTVTVTDANGCTRTATAMITQPPAMALSTSTTQSTCGGSNGTAAVVVTGGTSPYTYSWAPSGGNAATATGLSAGSYTVTVTDANGCTATAVAVVVSASGPAANISASTNVTCNGGCNGSATVSLIGGTAPFTYAWTPSGGNGPTATGLCAGIYTITVTDANSCTTSASVTITQPSALTAVMSSPTNVTCFSGCNGSATVTAGGGTPGYTYLWTPSGGNSLTATGLCAGTYTVTVTDANGCTVTSTITITQPTQLTATTVVTPVSCFGGCNGTSAVTAGGGTPGYTYSWAPSGGNAATATGLCAGTYTVTVTDANGCTQTATSVITQPTALALSTSATQSTCGLPNGSATVTVSGGTPAYTYSWAPSGGNGATATGLATGTYTVTVTDANGCTATATAFVPSANSPVISVSASTNVTCFSLCNGSANTTVTGGTAPYTYTWAPAGGNGANATGLCAGTFTVTVTDANGCTSTATVTITQPTLLTATISGSTNVSCFGGNNGSATVVAAGGTSPYTYAWAPTGGNTATGSNLTVGNYTVTITDANGCTATATVNITEPTLLQLSVAGFPATCNGVCNGTAVVIPSGGTPNYTFLWMPGNFTTASINALCTGIYTVTVSDANGCTISDTAIVVEPTAISLTTSFTTAYCGQADGTASVVATGGTPTYTYAWAPTGGNAANATGLLAGTYTVTVTDLQGCTLTATVVVPNTPGVTAAITASTITSCFNSCDGSATVTPTGGNSPYTYAWAPSGGNAATATGLCAGTYTVTVTDFNGCTDTAIVIITQPQQLVLNPVTPQVICNGQSATLSATATGGSAPYTFTWNPGNLVGSSVTVTPTSTTTYTVTVTDINGCTAVTQTVQVTVRPPLVVTGCPDVAICTGGSTTLTAFASGGNGGPYTITWTPGNLVGSPVTVNPTATTTYTVTVSDGCTVLPAIDTVIVTVNPLPVITFTTNPTPAAGCAPLCVDFVNSTPNGATCAWDFTVGTSTNCNTTFCFNNPGSYDVTLTVTDLNGCVNSLVQPSYVTVYPVPVADFSMTPQPTTILAGPIQFTDLSTGIPVMWDWSFGDVANSSSNVQNPAFMYSDTGSFTVQLIVENQYGCRDTALKVVRVDQDFTLFTPNAFTPDGNGMNDVFLPLGEGVDHDNFKMWIFDRWGNLIFMTDMWGKGWDGKANGGAEIAQEDVYVWKIEVKDFTGTKHSYVGHVSLIK